MCGRFSILANDDMLKERFEAEWPIPRFKRHNNAAPGQELPIVRMADPKKVTLGFWGLVPFWVKDLKDAKPIINARGDTILQKPSFKQAAEKRRCLVLADGFYEWQRRERVKIPYRIALKSDEPFAFAGIYEEREMKGKQLSMFAIVTTTPNAIMEPIHNRMPVILTRDAEKQWLDPALPPEKIGELLIPYDAQTMRAYPISTKVNSPTYDAPDILEPDGE